MGHRSSVAATGLARVRLKGIQLGAIALVFHRDGMEWALALAIAAIAGSFLVSGTVRVKCAPPPSASRTVTSPPCPRTMAVTIDSPTDGQLFQLADVVPVVPILPEDTERARTAALELAREIGIVRHACFQKLGEQRVLRIGEKNGEFGPRQRRLVDPRTGDEPDAERGPEQSEQAGPILRSIFFSTPAFFQNGLPTAVHSSLMSQHTTRPSSGSASATASAL